MMGYLQNGGPESHFANIGGNLGQGRASGQGMQNLTALGNRVLPALPTNWGDEYAKLGQMQYQGDYQRSLAQAQAISSAPPHVNPWIASLSAGMGALGGATTGGAAGTLQNASPGTGSSGGPGMGEMLGNYLGGGGNGGFPSGSTGSYGGNNAGISNLLSSPGYGGNGSTMGFIG